MSYEVKDSGKRVDYPTGAKRDTDEGKPRYELISPYSLQRVAHHLAKGAQKYESRNWERGIPTERLLASALRHVYAWQMGKRDEDHLAAVCFNIMAIMHFEELGGNPADGGASCGKTETLTGTSTSGPGHCTSAPSPTCHQTLKAHRCRTCGLDVFGSRCDWCNTCRA